MPDVPNSAQMSPSTLSTAQLNAIDLLASGAGIKRTAETVGVHRKTVGRWLRQNPWFIAALNEKRQLLWEDCHQRLRGMVSKALDVMEESLDEHDARTAIEVIKATGLYGNIGPPKGSTSENEIISQLSTQYAKKLLCQLDPDPLEHTRYVQRMLPILAAEFYQAIKDNPNEYLGVDEDEEKPDTGDAQ